MLLLCWLQKINGLVSVFHFQYSGQPPFIIISTNRPRKFRGIYSTVVHLSYADKADRIFKMARSFHVIKIIAHALFILFFLQIAKKMFQMFQNHVVKNFENYNQLSLWDMRWIFSSLNPEMAVLLNFSHLDYIEIRLPKKVILADYCSFSWILALFPNVCL